MLLENDASNEFAYNPGKFIDSLKKRPSNLPGLIQHLVTTNGINIGQEDCSSVAHWMVSKKYINLPNPVLPKHIDYIENALEDRVIMWDNGKSTSYYNTKYL